MSYESDYHINVRISGPTANGGYRSVEINQSYNSDTETTEFKKALKGIEEGMGFTPEAIEAPSRRELQ